MPSLGLNAAANIDVALGRVAAQLDKLQEVGVANLRIGWGRYVPLVGSITGINGQTAATVIPGPEAGRLLQIHRLSFAPQQGVAAATPGTIIIGKGPGMLTTAQGSGQLVAGQASGFIEVFRTTTVPGAQTWGSKQFVLQYPLNLVVLWASGTANVPLVIDGDGWEMLAETAQPDL